MFIHNYCVCFSLTRCVTVAAQRLFWSRRFSSAISTMCPPSTSLSSRPLVKLIINKAPLHREYGNSISISLMRKPTPPVSLASRCSLILCECMYGYHIAVTSSVCMCVCVSVLLLIYRRSFLGRWIRYVVVFCCFFFSVII